MAIKEFLFNLLPDFNTISGFIFYSLSVYAFILFMGWMAQPQLEEGMEEELRAARSKEGLRMREQYKHEGRKQK